MRMNIILVGVTISLFLLASPVAASDYTLEIFGNANEDDTLNMQDVTYTELIILEYRDATELADARYDGDIDILDMMQIALIILRREKELTFIDSADRIVTLDMPIKTMVIGHPGDAEAVRLLGAWGRVSGRDYYTTDEILFPGADNLPECSGENLYDIDGGVISGLNPDLYLTQFLPEPGFEDMVQKIKQRGIPVVALNFENPATLVRNIRLLKYILDAEEDGDEFITFYNNMEKKITKKTNGLSEDEKPRVFIWYFDNDYEKCYRTIGRGAPGIQAQFDIAGAKNIFANEAGVFPEIDPNRLFREDIDAIVCLVSPAVVKDIFGYEIEHPKLANEIKDWVMNPDKNPALAETTAVQNGEVYLIQNEMVWSPRHVVALTTKAKWFHLDLFMDLDRQKVHQQYLDTLNIDYDFDERGIFYWWGVVNKDLSDYGSTEGEYTKVNSAVSVKIRGIWDYNEQEWIYDGYLCGGGAVRTDPDEPEKGGWGCFNHYIKIIEKENNENFHFDIGTDDPGRMGCTPHSGEEEDYTMAYNILEASVNVMINLIGGCVNFAWAVASPFIDDLVSAIDTEELEDEQLTCEFLYPQEVKGGRRFPTDVGCWYQWEIIVKTEQTVKFNIYSYHIGVEDAWDVYAVEHSWTPIINAPPPFPGDFPAAMRLEYGIQEIPASEIKERAMEFSLSSAAVDELVNLGEPAYIVTDGIVIEKHPTKVFKTDLASYKTEFERRANND